MCVCGWVGVVWVARRRRFRHNSEGSKEAQAMRPILSVHGNTQAGNCPQQLMLLLMMMIMMKFSCIWLVCRP